MFRMFQYKNPWKMHLNYSTSCSANSNVFILWKYKYINTLLSPFNSAFFYFLIFKRHDKSQPNKYFNTLSGHLFFHINSTHHLPKTNFWFLQSTNFWFLRMHEPLEELNNHLLNFSWGPSLLLQLEQYPCDWEVWVILIFLCHQIYTQQPMHLVQWLASIHRGEAPYK